jgi:hypothetical protein
MQPNYSSQRSVMNIIGNDLTEHVLSFAPVPCLKSTVYVCKFFNDFVTKRIQESVYARVYDALSKFYGRCGSSTVDLEFYSPRWDLVKEFTCTFNFQNDLALYDLVDVSSKMKNLKKLEIDVWKQDIKRFIPLSSFLPVSSHLCV